MHEASEKIRKNQQALIDMQKAKIAKLKRMMDVSSHTPPMLRKDGQKGGVASRFLPSREGSQNSSLKSLKRRKSQPNRDSKNNQIRDLPGKDQKSGSQIRLHEQLSKKPEIALYRRRNSGVGSVESRSSHASLS